MAERDERELIAAVRRGDLDALGRLLKRYEKRLYNVVLRMVSDREDAAELTQDAMLKIVQHIQDFRGQSALSTWMIRIAMNLSISHLRKRQLRQTTSLDQTAPHDDQGTALRQQLADQREPSPDSNVEKKEMLGHLAAALDSVDGDFRAVLVLRDIDQMEYQQIAEVLAIPVGTVKSRLFRARLALRRTMLARVQTGGEREQVVKEQTHG